MDLNKYDYVLSCEAHVDTAMLHGRMLISYIRDKETRTPHGVIIAFKMKDAPEIKMGWSLCHPKKDRWNKYIAISKALERLGEPPTREALFEPWSEMYARAKRYFIDGILDHNQMMH